jgi:hypothetical protein
MILTILILSFISIISVVLNILCINKILKFSPKKRIGIFNRKLTDLDTKKKFNVKVNFIEKEFKNGLSNLKITNVQFDNTDYINYSNQVVKIFDGWQDLSTFKVRWITNETQLRRTNLIAEILK